MNSEELEQSLRTEFEGYLKNILADMKQEVSQFQQKIDTELEKHKSHLDEVFQDFSVRIETNRELDEGFKESVVEHLRLARDEGARITATAMAEAEELTKAEKSEKAETAAPSFELSDIRDAIYDISSQNSQSAILKSLINHAAKFTPRGAFFVLKNQHFVGWRVFGKQENLENDAITEIVFSTSASTLLGESVNSLSVIESGYGAYADDAEYLRQLNFGQPETMFAIPLIARGRGVAAIYADNGDNTEKVNVEALETLVSVAGLTVELLAAAQSSNYTREPVRASSYVAAPAAAQENVEEIETQPAEFVEERTEVVEETVSIYEETEITYSDKTAPEDTYSAADSDIQEVEVEEPVSYQEPVSDLESSEMEEEIVSEVSGESESSETEQEAKVEESYSFSSEETTESETIEPDYAVYDDDLIEEVQAQAETSESAEEVESVYEEIPSAYVQLADAPEETEDLTDDQPTEEVEEISHGYSMETDSPEYSESDNTPIENAVTTEVSDNLSIAPSYEYPEFETNQDFNSTPVQFKETVEPVQTVEATDFAFTKPAEENWQAEKIQEVSPVAEEMFEAAESEVAEEAIVVEEPVKVAEPVSTAPIRSRFSERNVDLPIEVSEEERRLHNDARRFARLLVSEIKLYNEQKVKEGRDAYDLYERLREAIDRSREMYDKRVQPAVVERFDYFHYEVVHTLAEGEESKLGTTYPGAIN